MLNIAIIGAGLSGLAVADRLHRAGQTFELFESRLRPGGRILSVMPARSEGSDPAPFRYDLGPGWIWPDSQPRIAALVQRFGLTSAPQWIEGYSLYQAERGVSPQAYRDPATYGDARRMEGGVESLVEALCAKLPQDRLHLGHHLEQVSDQGDSVALRFRNNGDTVEHQARQLVLALPPRVVASSLSFTPALDLRLIDLMQRTPTWMAGHAKVLVRYSRPFWRDAGLSGAALSGYRGAPLGEIFDAGSQDGEHAALSGFFALPVELRRQYRDDLYALVIDQLIGLFGPQAAHPQELMIKEWCDEPLTATAADENPPSQHPQYGHRWFELDHWSDKLHFCGTETAAQFGGYLEGALEAADRVADALLMGLESKEVRCG